jgi:hypothetical protein
MEKEVKLDSIKKRKIFLILTKYIPHLIGILYVIYTILSFIEIEPIIIGYITSLSILPWLYLYSASRALEFCYVHRLPLYYILIDEILLVTDNYLCIPVNVYNLFVIHLLLIGLLVFGYTYYYIKFKLRK